MKFSCQSNEFSIALTNISKIVASRSNLATMEGILLEVFENRICISGYNFDLAIFTHIFARVEQSGKIILNAKLFTEIIRRIPDSVIDIKCEDGIHLKITSDNAVFDIVGIDATSYPELPNVSVDNTMVMSADIFKNMVNKTIYAVSTDDTKLIYTGALLNVSKGIISFVALDGFRMALKSEPVEFCKDFSVICPGKSLQEVARLILKTGQDIFIDISHSHIMFRVSEYTIIAKLLEGRFLDYEATMPIKFDTELTIKTINFINSIERISVVVQNKMKVPITLNIKDNVIHLNCESITGSANDKLDCEMNGKPLAISFNSRLLLDSLRAAGCESVILKMNGSLAPVIVEPTNKEDDNFKFLVLPVRMAESDTELEN